MTTAPVAQMESNRFVSDSAKARTLPGAPPCSLCDYRTVRWIPSTETHYTVEALPFTGEPWLFRYVYITEATA